MSLQLKQPRSAIQNALKVFVRRKVGLDIKLLLWFQAALTVVGQFKAAVHKQKQTVKRCIIVKVAVVARATLPGQIDIAMHIQNISPTTNIDQSPARC
jgi:hypothetical protein